MDLYKLSIIIPVYNVGKPLQNCLDSIVSQSYEDYEIIIVNDGSTDQDTIAICEKYATKYNHIRCIHKKNMGCLDSRITGVKFAKGRFCTYCDSDDYVADDYFEQLIRILKNNADLYVLNNFLVELDSDECRPEDHGFEDGCTDIGEIRKKIMSMQMGAVWNKVYKTELLKKAVDSVFLRMNLCDDSYINMRYLTEASTVYVSNVAIYYHVIDSRSSVCANDISMYRLHEIDELYKVQEKVKNEINLQSEYNRFMGAICGLYFRTIAKLVQQGCNYIELKSEMEEKAVYRALKSWKTRSIKLSLYRFIIINKNFNLIKVLTVIRGRKWKY